jgi:cation transport ATPase
MPTTHLKIAKLDDATDIAHIEKALEAVPGVQSARVVADENEAVVEHENADTTEMTTAVKKLGYVSTPE